MADAIQMSEAIAALQKAQLQLSEAVAAIGEHNQSSEAHPIILRLIEDLKHSEAIFSRSQVRALVDEVLNEHTSKKIDEAHTGFKDIIDEITNRQAKIESDMEVLTDKVNGTAQGAKSKLERAIMQVEDKYAPVLASLQSTLSNAELAGQTALADATKAQISEVLADKRVELINVMEAWSQEQRDS